MKIFTKITLLLLASVTLVFAELSIDAQIQEIKNAPPAQRVELMNALKMRLSTMNAQERSDTISALRTQSRTRSEQAQADNMHQMQGMESMNRKQAADFLMQHETATGGLFGGKEQGR